MAGQQRKAKVTVTGAQAQMHEQARARLIMMVMVLMMGYLAISLRLVDLTLLHRETVATSKTGELAMSSGGLRASIVDRNGLLMATSLKMASVYVDATKIEDTDGLTKDLAAILTEQSAANIRKKLMSGKKFIWIQRNITPRQQYAINALGVPALGFQEEERRIYPDGNLAAHVLGYTDVDGHGIAGLEKFFDKRLREDGSPLQLTIDLRVQHMMRRELSKALTKFQAKGAVGLVMDARTGEVVSMVSLPDFDPNHIRTATDSQKFNRATLGVFEMGSTFKLFSTAAALDSGKVHFSTMFDASDPIKVGRFTISDYHAKRRALSVPEIFIYSSNVGTAKMADSLGETALPDFFRSLGFMSQTPFELPERGTPLYPSPWREVSTLTTSFGHGIAVSPLHVARAAAALVNGGTLPMATLVKSETHDEGTRVVSAKTSAQLRKLLELVVAAGTGDKAFVEGYDVGGKTGTAEKNAGGRYEKNLLMSSFLGVFPAQDPRYIVLAILDEPHGTKDTYGFATAGWTAAPVVAHVVEQMGPLYGLMPDYTRTRHDIAREMSGYLKEYKEGTSLASAGNDH